MSSKDIRLFTVLSILIGLPAATLSQSSALQTTPNSSTAKAASSSMSEMPEVLVAPLFIEAGGFTSQIVMVNELTFAVSADVVLFDRNGATIVSQTVNFPPHSQQALTVGDLLLQANSAETMGSVEIYADPAKVYTMAIAAQLSITGSGINAGQHIEEELVMLGTKGSGVLRSAGTALVGQSVVALKNTGAAAQTATITCLAENTGATQQQVPLPAGGSAFVQACSNSVNPAFSLVGDALTAPASAQANLGAFGISVAGTGTAGSLLAFGFAWRTTTRGPMLSSQNFLDAGLAQSGNVVFTGVPIGAATALPGAAFTPEVAVTNFSAKDANATVVFARTDDSGPTATPVGTAVVPAMSSKTIPLPALTGDPGLRNSFIVQSDAAPGTFYASIVSVGSSGFDLVEQIGKDQLSGENAGNHPWSLTDASQDALLLMFNHSTTATYFNVMIGSGGVLWQQAWQLAPMETRAVSIRELIADQVKDEKGATLPKTLDQGEISWFTPDPGEGKGRLVQIDRAPQLVAGNIRVARNFSCGQVVVLCGATLDTASITFPAGTYSTSYLGAVIAALCLSDLYTDCEGQSHGTGGSGYSYLWTSNDTTIATVNGSGTTASTNFFGAGPGQGSATGEIYSHYCSGEGSGTPSVQTPSALSGPNMETLLTYTNGTFADCGLNIVATHFYGWSQCADYTVLDQFSPPGQIKQAGLQFNEQVVVTDDNGSGGTTDTGSGSTTVNYILKDTLSLGGIGGPLPSDTYMYERQTITYGTTTVRVNCIYKTTSGVTVTDITSNPNAACHH